MSFTNFVKSMADRHEDSKIQDFDFKDQKIQNLTFSEQKPQTNRNFFLLFHFKKKKTFFC